jgi:hypothetical protein
MPIGADLSFPLPRGRGWCAKQLWLNLPFNGGSNKIVT